MPKRALTEKRPLLLAALGLAMAFFLLRDTAMGGLWLILIKGSSIASLAIYAVLRHSGRSARLLAAILVLASVGIMLMDIDIFWGRMLLFFSHIMALPLFLRHPREQAAGSQKAAAIALLIMVPVLSLLLSQDLSAAVYTLSLGGMAAAAWMSRFSRYRVGLGAILIVISSLLSLADMGGYVPGSAPQWLAWPTYFVGHFLMATGIIQTLRSELPKAGSAS